MRGSFGELADHIGGVSLRLRAAPERAAVMTAPLIKYAIHEEFGKAPPLADLAPATQDDRTAKGFAPNDPLVRTHALQESYVDEVGHGADGPIAAAGSSDPLALPHEHGFFNVRAKTMVPPRPAAFLGFQAVQPLAKTIWKNVVGRAIKR
jgi:hypothetical protein